MARTTIGVTILLLAGAAARGPHPALAAAARTANATIPLAPCPPVTAGPSIHQGPVTITAALDGCLQIADGRSRYLVAGGFSYPGRHIGWNTFAAPKASGQSTWSPAVRRTAQGTLNISAQGSQYRIERRIRLERNQVRITDRVTNISRAPAGLFIRNTITAARPFARKILPGAAWAGCANPTLYVRGKRHALGVVVEDNLGRLLLEMKKGAPANQVGLGFHDLALPAGKSHTFRWSIYLLPARASYFNFINRLRRAWRCNFTIRGPLRFFSVNWPPEADLLKNPGQLRAWIRQRGLQTGAVVLTSWLDYLPGYFRHFGSRQRYLVRMRQAIRAFHDAAPGIKVVGAVEGDWITFDSRKLAGGWPALNAGSRKYAHLFGLHRAIYGELSSALSRIVETAPLSAPWRDCMKYAPDGHVIGAKYLRRTNLQKVFSVGVYPAPGNAQEKFLLNQVHFLLEKVGMDGVYIDEFSDSRDVPISYHGWDRHTAILNRRTGKIERLTVNCGYVGIPARLKIIHAVLGRGKILIANTWATSAQEQPCAVTRFQETSSLYRPYPSGAKPPWVDGLLQGDLNSLVNLGTFGAAGARTKAPRPVMKAIIEGLRNGTLYFQSFGYVPGVESHILRRMYPITPVALHAGWIQGRQRIISCVSGRYRWRSAGKPIVRVFDLRGRAVRASFTLRRMARGWRINLALKNWAQVAIIR